MHDSLPSSGLRSFIAAPSPPLPILPPRIVPVGQTATLNGWGCGFSHVGEILQGVFEIGGDWIRALVTLPCRYLTSSAEFIFDSALQSLEVTPATFTKAKRAAQIALRWLHLPVSGRLAIRSDVPDRQGYGRSTADIVAAVRAVFDAFRIRVAPHIISRIAVMAETASDSTMYDDAEVRLFAHRQGNSLLHLGPLPALVILAFNTDPTGLDTLSFPPAEYNDDERDHLRMLLAALQEAINSQDIHKLGRVASQSAEINQRFLPKHRFAEIEHLAADIGAAGVAVAHSGTVSSIVLDPQLQDLPNRIMDAIAELDYLGMSDVFVYDSRRAA